tara:strand:+ start:239 stop:550 length:312 start_codon:yes stop_codon:yes gene_type:complete
MKIMVLGASGIGNQMATALALHLALKQVEIVTVESIEDTDPNDGDVLICDDNDIVYNRHVYCGHPLANIGESVFPQEIRILERDNSFRGGSRGKGGKIKYARK